jgi:hypothetical protein
LTTTHSIARRFPDPTLREQLGDLLASLPSGHDLPAFRAASGFLRETG